MFNWCTSDYTGDWKKVKEYIMEEKKPKRKTNYINNKTLYGAMIHYKNDLKQALEDYNKLSQEMLSENDRVNAESAKKAKDKADIEDIDLE